MFPYAFESQREMPRVREERGWPAQVGEAGPHSSCMYPLLETLLCDSVVIGLWESPFIFLSLSFLVCKMGITTVITGLLWEFDPHEVVSTE